MRAFLNSFQVSKPSSPPDSYAMIDNMPIAAMVCELENFTITYANQKSFELMKEIENELPIEAKNLRPD